MKIFQFVLGLTVLMLALWTATVPAKISGAEVGGIGDGCPCADEINRKCTTREDASPCTIYTLRCDGSGSKTCMDMVGAGSQPCKSSESRCFNEEVQDCS
jgi:hypothetical protein